MSAKRVTPGVATTANDQRIEAQRRFVSTIHDVAAHVVDELLALPSARFTIGVPQSGALHEWAERWRLDAPWALQSATRYYQQIASCPPEWRHLERWGGVAGGGVLEVQAPAWRVNWESAETYRRRVDLFIAEVLRRIDDEKLVGDGVAVEAPIRLDASAFVRLVNYQVLGQSARQIARDEHSTGRTPDGAHTDVMGHVRDVAQLIELPLRRSSSGGRPSRR